MTAPADQTTRLRGNVTPIGGWVQQAACADHVDPHNPFSPDPWFSADPDEQAEAVRICRDECAVSTQCLGWALANEPEDGVWAGWTPQQRRAWKRKQRRRSAA